MMIQTVELVNRASTCSRVTEVERDVGGRESHGFLGNIQETHPHWEGAVLMDRVNEVCGIQIR